MKKYSEYMDNISVEPNLHNKIMKRAIVASKPKKRATLRYAGLAAVAAAFLLGIMFIPALNNLRLQDPADILTNEPNQSNGYSETAPTNTGEEIVPTPVNSSEETASILTATVYHPLILNWYLDMDAVLGEAIGVAARSLPNQFFWHELTPEQLQAVLPDLGFSVTACAYYFSSDNSLFEVSIRKLAPCGNVVTFNDFFFNVAFIRIAPTSLYNWALFDIEPVVSYVHGIPVTAWVNIDFGIADSGMAQFFASFVLDGISYDIAVHDYAGGEDGPNRLTEIVNTIILNGPADLSVLADPAKPEMRHDNLTLDEAIADPDFGAFLPAYIPDGFSFSSAQRLINQHSNDLMAFWDTGRLNTIMWIVSEPTAHDLAHIVCVTDYEKYDLSLYPIPWMDSVPDEIFQYLMNPVFCAKELTLDTIQRRAVYESGRRDMPSSWRVNFSVLYDGVVVRINIGGVPPEIVWDMLGFMGR